MEILKVHDLCKTYGKGEAEVEALKKVSFSLDKGEFAAIVGESGSGKSTQCTGFVRTVKVKTGSLGEVQLPVF